MKQAQIAIYVILGLVIFLVFVGLLNLTLQIVPTVKAISTKDVNVFISSCLDLSTKCALYNAGLNSKNDIQQIKASSEDFIKQSLNICLGDLSQKFKGNKFKLLNSTPNLIFGDELTSVSIEKLGDLINGNSKTSLNNYASKLQIAYSKIHSLAQSLPKPNSDKERLIQIIDPRFKINVYQLGNEEAVIITDSLSKINDKNYKAVFVN